MNRFALSAGLVLVIPLIAFLALGLRFDPSKIDSPLVGKPAPEFALTDLNGLDIRLPDLRGRPVVINFWATWCQACVVEHPVLREASRRFEGRVHFLGLIYQDDPVTVGSFLDRYGSWGPSLVDPEARLAIAYGVYGVPETFILDSQGVIVDKVTGPVNAQELFRTLEALTR